MNYAEYTLTGDKLKQLQEVCDKCATEVNGVRYLPEFFINQMGLTPRHVTENIPNTKVKLDPFMSI